MRGVTVGIATVMLMIAGLASPASAQEAIDGVRITRTEARTLVLTWTPEPGASSYDVLQDGVVVETSDDNWFVAIQLEPLTDYTFSIRADTGAESAPLTAGTAALTPAPTSIDVWWVGPRGTTLAFGFGQFEIRRDGVVIAERNGRVLRDTGLRPETTYRYEVYPIGAAGNLGPASVQVITTEALLAQVQGVQAELVEPGVVQVSWEALETSTRYRVFVDGELKTAPTSAGATSARVSVTPGATSLIQVGGYNGGGGPLSEPVTVVSDQLDPRQIGLRLHASWPGTVVLNWRNRTKWEKVFFNGQEVGLGQDGWVTISDLPYDTDYEVVVRSFVDGAASESVSYPITTATVQLFDVQNFNATAVSTDSVKVNWRKTPFVNFELRRNGEPIAILTQSDAVPYFDTGLTPGTSYTYTIQQVAEGATGQSNPVTATVTTPIAP